MAYYLRTTAPEDATGQLRATNATLAAMFPKIPNVFTAQSLRPDLLEPLVAYVNRLMLETHALTRTTKELIAAHVSRINACAY